MVTRTKTTHNMVSYDTLTLIYEKAIEFGGGTSEDIKDVREIGSTDNNETTVIRFWPNAEAAQSWIDFMLAQGTEVCIKAEILED